MPLINIKVSASTSPALTAKISTQVSDLTSRILGKKEDLIATVITYVRPEDWLIGGKTLSKIGVSSFSLEIIVTDETNTKAEKAKHLAEVFACFERLLGPVHPASYVHVHDARASAYGYGGRTQEARLHQS
ncbi:4-oxalocrotonate tautomerase family protein (plasmid) [Xanthomonas citri pv. citri]|uniref:tautomerase family protein n=1 Tax=Xanthomonas TaxID=338 RepID=UPI0019345B8E|nr:4-oxalocrotonate tautomerase family protein [Xanthomonas citri]QRD62607.1 4-oxalocrotonate tautomerase family protein [Xanthomonas citri pv. citri]QRD67141.1 4-oxalocrotonate tautomerase family protein [Xanthomonas citri pv. citri]QRD71813.1 4-oxalocrotonate tautomerase family protein [Xanthomonas citri pv. citri]